MSDTKKTTIVLFSGEYDKVMAAYIIANGAAAYDHEVTIFHTFWGLNAMRKMNRSSRIKHSLRRCSVSSCHAVLIRCHSRK